MTDQRNRVTTDPGLGPIQREHASTLRSMTVAEPVPEDEIAGAPVYYEPKPLHAASEHKTLELETVKLAKDIDPRKLPTELKLRRPVLHVLPASDPNWPAPEPQDLGWPPPQFDSGWPPPETVLTSSQPPLAARRRSYIPFVILVLLAASVLLVLGARARRRSLLPTVTAHAMQPMPASAPVAAPPPTPSLRQARLRRRAARPRPLPAPPPLRPSRENCRKPLNRPPTLSLRPTPPLQRHRRLRRSTRIPMPSPRRPARPMRHITRRSSLLLPRSRIANRVLRSRPNQNARSTE